MESTGKATSRSEVYSFLKLANNGYTFKSCVPANYLRHVDKLVELGLVKQAKFLSSPDMGTVFFMKEHFHLYENAISAV